MNLLLLLYLLPLQSANNECQDSLLPTAARELIGLLSKMKGKSSIKLFGIDTISNLPTTSNFQTLKMQILNFSMGQFFPQLIVFILGIISFVVTFVFIIFICVCCLPENSSRPKCCIVFWWVFFSLFFGVSIAYFILAIIETPKFIDNFPKILNTIDDAAVNIRDTYENFVKNYYTISINAFSGANGSFGSPSILVQNGKFKTQSIAEEGKNMLNLIDDSILYINDLLTTNKCDNAINIISPDLTLFNNEIIPELEKVSESLQKVDNSSANAISIFAQKLQKNILDIYTNFPSTDPWINIVPTLSIYRDVSITKAAPSFDTNNDYYKAMRYLMYIVVCLLLILYIFQTVTVCMRNSFSRCCSVANQPISFIISILVGIIGIVTTSMACSISDVCVHSTEFAANFFSGKPEYQIYNLPQLKPDFFSSQDDRLYNVLEIEKIANFSKSPISAISSIESPTFIGVDELSIPANDLNTAILGSTKNLTDNILAFLETSAKLEKKIISSSNCAPSEIILTNISDLIQYVNKLYYIINFDLPLIQKAIASFSLYNETESKGLFSNSFSNIPYFEAISDELLNTSLFTCPLYNSKQYFCKEAGGTFAYIAIFAHFYLVSLIGFAGLLCCRRKGMIDKMFDSENSDRKTNNTPKRSAIWSQNYANGGGSADSSSSSERGSMSSSDSFDMFQQSRAGVI